MQRWDFLSKLCTSLLVLLLAGFRSDAPLTRYLLPIRASSVCTSDIDLDGDADIVVGHRTGWQKNNPSISILENSGGLFTIIDTSKSYCGYQENLFTCKIDGDPYPDLVTFYSDFSTGTAYRFIRVWYNLNGTFNDFQDFSLNSSATFTGMTPGDVNGDGWTDILVWSADSRFWGVLYNPGTGFLTPPEYHSVTGYYPTVVASGDLNGDGRDDVVVSGQSTEVYYSFPTGFTAEVLETGNFKDMNAVVDFDGDGDNDLLTAVGIPIVGVSSLIMYSNQNDTSLLELPEVYFQPPSLALLATDLNNDSLPDLAFLTLVPDTSGTGMVDTIGGINILYNLGNFQLSAPQLLRLKNFDETTRNFTSADLDGNGYNDFAIIRGTGLRIPNLEILFNDGNGNFVGTPVGVSNPAGDEEAPDLRCCPNPFRESAVFQFNLTHAARVDLSVYDSYGKRIQCVLNQEVEQGRHKIPFVLLNEASGRLHGVFFARIRIDGKHSHTIKIIKN